MACPQMVVQLDRGLMKLYINQTNVLEGYAAVVEHKEKDQAFGLCRCLAYKTHIKSIAVFVDSDNRIKLAGGKFMDKESDMEMTQLECGCGSCGSKYQ
jgi:hypothetical protein